MNKEEILKMSRKENSGRFDERDILAFGAASRVGMFVGTIVCFLLAFASELIFHLPEIGFVSWIVYFSIHGSSMLALYKELKNRKHLTWGIISIAAAFFFLVGLVLKSVVQL